MHEKSNLLRQRGWGYDSFDPNLREPLWESLDLAKEQMEYGFRQCDVLKISDNEIQFVTGQEDYDKGIRMLQEKYHIPLILLTMGKEGSRAYYKEMCVKKAGFCVEAIETTGAGDTFCGCALGYLLEHNLEQLSKEEFRGTADICKRRGGADHFKKRSNPLECRRKKKSENFWKIKKLTFSY